MLLAQIVYLVIDVGKSITEESCISVDMTENILNFFLFFFLSKVWPELTLSVKTCFNALAWLFLLLDWFFFKKQNQKNPNISVPVKCSLFATSPVTNFSNYTVISLTDKATGHSCHLVYWDQDLNCFVRTDPVWSLICCLCYSPFTTKYHNSFQRMPAHSWGASVIPKHKQYV